MSTIETQQSNTSSIKKLNNGDRYYVFGTDEEKFMLNPIPDNEAADCFETSEERALTGVLEVNPAGIYYAGIPDDFLEYVCFTTVSSFNKKMLEDELFVLLDKELELVPENLKTDYLLWRRNFFENMMGLYADYLGKTESQMDKNYYNQCKNEMKICRNYLDGIISKEGIEEETKKLVAREMPQ